MVSIITPEQLAKSGSESGNQSALFCWAQQSGIPELKWLFAIPNGFFSTSGQKAKMMAEGLRPGVWDIHLPLFTWNVNEVKGSPYHGLWIEMKHERMRNRRDGGLSDNQIEFRNDHCQSYRFVVCYSWLEARDAILQYLGKV